MKTIYLKTCRAIFTGAFIAFCASWIAFSILACVIDPQLYSPASMDAVCYAMLSMLALAVTGVLAVSFDDCL